MSDTKITADVAELEFARFVNLMDLDVDTSTMDDDDRAGFDKQKARIIRAITAGSLVVNDNGEPIFTPQRSDNTEPLTFFEPTGAALMAMDKRKKSEDVAKMYSVMAAMTKTNPARFSSMKLGDLNICTAIVTLFLG